MSLQALLDTAVLMRGPRRLEDPAEVYLVASGGVDIFLQRRPREARSAGARLHVWRAGPGQIILALGAQSLPLDYGLVAVPLPDTRLVASSTTEVAATLAPDTLLALCENWVSALLTEMETPPAPRQVRLIARGDPMTLEPGETLRGSEGTCWVTLERGIAHWMGRPDSPLGPARGVWPLHRAAWLTASEAVAVREHDPLELLREARLWPALTVHQQLVLSVLIAAASLEKIRAESHQENRAQHSLILTQEAMQQLLSVANNANPRQNSAHQDHCLTATRLIGERLGINFLPPPPAEARALATNPVAAIANTSQIQSRRVMLKGEWWTGDNGPLLARSALDQHWIALLPHRGGYLAVTPGTNDRQPVTEELAGQLEPFATMFYRALPPTPVRIPALLRFLAWDRGVDLAVVLGLGLLGGLLGIAMPLATAFLVDNIIPSADIPALWQMVGALAAATLATTLFEVTRAVAVLRLETRMDNDLQAAIWDRTVRLPAQFFRDYSAGDLAARINGVNVIRRALSRTTVAAFLNGIFSLSSFVLLFYFSTDLALLASALV
ncbi:MAG: hypothetical protein EXR83_00005, partial [Gammaproteobacteria bacterium]|nr:hypothetical protein [Gammaproteobacteria bacterium]